MSDLVRDAMVPEPLALDASASAQEAGEALAREDVRAVFVCDGGRFVGVVTRKTLVREVVAKGLDPRSTALGAIAEPPNATIDSSQALGVAFAFLEEHDYERVPVVEDGRLVGIVTRADLVRLFTRSDDEIARDIRQDVIRRLWIAPERIEVEVEQGEVVLRGEVDTEVEADLLLKRIPLVAGVVGVRSELAWAVDKSGNSSRR